MDTAGGGRKHRNSGRVERYTRKWNRYLKSLKLPNPDQWTHVSEVTPKTSFYVSSIQKPAFIERYVKTIQKGVVLGVAEKPREIMPLIIDIDMKFDDTGDLTRRYTSEDVVAIVRIYQSILEELYANVEPRHLRAIVLEKGHDMRIKNGREGDPPIVKDGIHIQFPFTMVSRSEQKTIIRPRAITKMCEQKIFDDLNTSNTIENIVDACIGSVPWLMYMSRKDDDTESYVVRYGVNENGDMCTPDDVFGEEATTEFLVTALSIEQPNHAELQLRHEFVESIKPRSDDSTGSGSAPKAVFYDVPIVDIKKYLKSQVEPLLKCIKPSTWDSYREWFEIGACLHKLSRGTEVGLDLWKKYSQKSAKFDDGESNKSWKSMNGGQMSIGTIKYYAKRDSPDKYRVKISQISELSINDVIKEPLEAKVAQFIANYFRHEFKCVEPSKRNWVMFRPREVDGIVINPQKWDMDKNGSQFLMAVIKEIPAEITAAQICKTNLVDKSEKEITEWNKACAKLKASINTHAFLMRMIDFCKHFLHDPQFLTIHDTNQYTLCFPNGVLCMEGKNEPYFRSGQPGDNIMKSMGYPLYTDMSHTDPRYVRMKRMLHQILPEKPVRRYFKTWAGSCLQGGNIDKLLIVWIGEKGNNAKSWMAKMMKAVFHENFFSLPVGTITEKGGKGGDATADLVRMHGQRVCSVAETDGQKQEVNIATLKRLTGGDDIYVRALYGEGGEMKAAFKLFVQCNSFPKIPKYDKAFYNRLRLIPFISQFLPADKCPATEAEQERLHIYPEDTHADALIPYLAPAFIHILYKGFLKYTKYGVMDCDAVRAKTSAFKQENDTLMSFFRDRLMMDPKETNIKKCLSLPAIYQLFKDWYKENFPGASVPDSIVVRNDFRERFGEPEQDGRTWRFLGVKLAGGNPAEDKSQPVATGKRPSPKDTPGIVPVARSSSTSSDSSDPPSRLLTRREKRILEESKQHRRSKRVLAQTVTQSPEGAD